MRVGPERYAASVLVFELTAAAVDHYACNLSPRSNVLP